ncbi:hypothetical protein NCHU2750_24570 [Neorhizobium sp. NCHU2750]|nr:hypothetical protein NCHU2750_24570 [Neorhizobium sp. NCHU2750]
MMSAIEKSTSGLPALSVYRVPQVPLWPAGHLPHKGGEDLRRTRAPNWKHSGRGWVKPSPLWGGFGRGLRRDEPKGVFSTTTAGGLL